MKFKYLVIALLLVSVIFAASTLLDDLKKKLNTELGYMKDAVMTASGSPSGFKYATDIFQPGYCGDSWRSKNGTISLDTWIYPTWLVIITLSFVVAILYMAGQVFQSPKLIAFAKDEGYQMVMISVVIVFISGLVAGADAWYAVRGGWAGAPLPDGSVDTLYQVNPTYIDASMAVSRYFIAEMISDYSMLVLYNMLIHTLYSSTMWFGVTWRAMYSFNLGPVLKPLIDILGMAMQFLGLAISEWMLHLILLCLIKRWTWGMFVPFAIFLRAIPQTRGAGAALLALSLCLSLFYPFMIIMNYEVHKVMQYNLASGSEVMENFIERSGLFGVAGLGLAIMFIMGGVFIPVFLGTGLSVAFQLIKNAVYYIVIIGLLLPFLNIFVTLTAAKETARAFSVEVSFLSFLKII